LNGYLLVIDQTHLRKADKGQRPAYKGSKGTCSICVFEQVGMKIRPNTRRKIENSGPPNPQAQEKVVIWTVTYHAIWDASSSRMLRGYGCITHLATSYPEGRQKLGLVSTNNQRSGKKNVTP